MEKEPLLPYLSPRGKPSPIPPQLCPLPENDEITLPMTPTEFKDRLIFGPSSSPQDASPIFDALTLSLSSSRPSASSSLQDPSTPLDPRSQSQSQQAWLVDSNYTWPKSNLHRSRTAPAMAVINDVNHSQEPKPQFGKQSIIRQAESYLLRNVKRGVKRESGKSYIIDVKKGRMRIRMKVALALGVVILCIGVGMGVMHFVENLGWLDSFYLSVMSVTTVGYGDQAFKSMTGRIFASIWLLVSTLAVARAFLYLAEARVDKRHRMMAKWILGQDMTVSEFLAADIDNNGFVSRSEYVIYKLKEMGKVSEKDVMQISNNFDRLDSGKCGKITLADLLESHH
uniref:Potassium channel domain-containing protein n=1 Tax=Cucumis sativus TaxID=3659 RepID=A0A0A0KI16_CUCSA